MAPAKVFRIALTGPAANGLMALVLLLCTSVAGTRPENAHGVGALVWAVVVANLAEMLLNLVPWRTSRGMLSDGAQLLVHSRRG